MEDESDSDWDEMTTQPVVEHSTATENASVNRVSQKEEVNRAISKEEEIKRGSLITNLPDLVSEVCTVDSA